MKKIISIGLTLSVFISIILTGVRAMEIETNKVFYNESKNVFIQNDKEIEAEYEYENGVQVRKVPKSHIFLSELDRKKAEMLLVKYQDYCSKQNEKKLMSLSEDNFFTKEEKELLNKNIQDHQLKYVGVQQQNEMNSNDVNDGSISLMQANKNTLLIPESFKLYEKSVSWLSTHNIPDYQEAGITTDDLKALLEQMSDYNYTSEYEWIESAYNRMIEDIAPAK